MGIVHARRIGVPVILVDPNFIKSPLLESIADHTARDCEGALSILVREIAPSFGQRLTVIKRNGHEVAFSQQKLQRSIRVACAQAGVDDTVFPIWLSRYACRTIMGTASQGKITADQIKEAVFQELGRLAANDRLGGVDQEVREEAKKVREAWEYRELEKHEVGNPARELEAALGEIEELSGALAQTRKERDELQARLRALEIRDAGSKPKEDLEAGHALLAILTRELCGRQCLCIAWQEKSSFRNAFHRHGLSPEEFSRFFAEESRSGKLSNLNAEIKADLSKYPYVLYAANGLRHLSPENRAAPNLIWGAGPNDVVRRFLHKLEPRRQPQPG